MMTLIRFSAAALVLSGMISTASAEPPKVEVLHYWTSGSEAAGLNVLKTLLSKEGVQWTDSPVAGGTGGNMVQVLRSRIAAGYPVTGSVTCCSGPGSGGLDER